MLLLSSLGTRLASEEKRNYQVVQFGMNTGWGVSPLGARGRKWQGGRAQESEEILYQKKELLLLYGTAKHSTARIGARKQGTRRSCPGGRGPLPSIEGGGVVLCKSIRRKGGLKGDLSTRLGGLWGGEGSRLQRILPF